MAYDWSITPPERVLNERFGMQQFHSGQREIKAIALLPFFSMLAI
jgi:hypothetical protein